MTAAQRLEGLFEQHHQRLFRLARRMTGDPEESRDLVQEVFMRAARRPSSLPADPAFDEAWLVRVLVNLCRDRNRRMRLQAKTREFLQDNAGQPPVHFDPPDGLTASVARALKTLPPRQRAIAVLHDLEEREVAEIARLLGITRVTVRWHLAAARSRLKTLLADEMGRLP